MKISAPTISKCDGHLKKTLEKLIVFLISMSTPPPLWQERSCRMQWYGRSCMSSESGICLYSQVSQTLTRSGFSVHKNAYKFDNLFLMDCALKDQTFKRLPFVPSLTVAAVGFDFVEPYSNQVE